MSLSLSALSRLDTLHIGGKGRRLRCSWLSSWRTLVPSLSLFLDVAVFLNRKLLDEGVKNFFWRQLIIFCVPVAEVLLLLLCFFECVLDVVEPIEGVELGDDFLKNWLTIVNQNVQNLFIFFNIVRGLLSEEHLLVLRQ